MSDYRLKVKIGDHEFEADGPVDAVKSQFETFKELIAANPVYKTENTSTEVSADKPIVPQSRIANIERIFRQDGRVISLTVPPESLTDAVLLILYGQKHFRNNENPTGGEIIDGMEQSGYHAIRISRVLAPLSAEGMVIITGAHRGKRYRLTNQGFAKAEDNVRKSLAKLP